MIKNIVELVFLLLPLYSYALNNVEITLHFIPTYAQQKINLGDSALYSYKGQPLKLTSLKFYIIQIELLKDDKLVYTVPQSYHLVDAANDNSLYIKLPTKTNVAYNQISFQIGIDSATNVAGVLAGDLDPTKGMYWTWQSGYINFKLEGESTFCPTRHNEFQFHIGGYLAPYSATQKVTLHLKNQATLVPIKVDIEKLLLDIDLTKQHNIMSPGVAAYQFSLLLKEIFYTDEAP